MSQGSTTTRPAGETPRRIEYLALGELEGTPGNPKLHDLDALKASIQRHGLAEVPLRDDRTGRIVAGHGRIDELRAQLLAGESPPDGVRLRADGEWLVPVLVGWRSKSDVDAKHYVIASNQTRGCPAATASPSAAPSRITAPGIGASNEPFSTTDPGSGKRGTAVSATEPRAEST